MGAARREPGDGHGAGSIHIAFDFPAASKEVRRVEQDQSLDFASGLDRLGSRPDAFKGSAASAWTKALGVLGDAHREAMKPLPALADNIEDAGVVYHSTDDEGAADISSAL